MKKKGKKGGIGSTILLVGILVLGLSMLLYPSVSNYWNSMHETREIKGYVETVDRIDKELCQKLWDEAIAYNESLLTRADAFSLSDEEKEAYIKALDINDTGMMGYIEIPKIDVSLPIYHGTEEHILLAAAGHLEWSSLPVGGVGSHCVLSGHRGLPSAKLFTDLDQLQEGDTFFMRVLDEVLTYEVDQIRIVLPDEVTDLLPDPEKDLCTLVTCTPYGINTHRLLVRGHRIPNDPYADAARITADAIQIEPLIVAPVLAVPLLLILIVLVSLTDKKRKEM